MTCFRVLVHGVNREAAEADDGIGFYTAQSVRAENQEHAAELAFRLVREDPRSTESGPLIRLAVDQMLEVDCSEVGERHGYVHYAPE
jgi:hypothetical protein